MFVWPNNDHQAIRAMLWPVKSPESAVAVIEEHAVI